MQPKTEHFTSTDANKPPQLGDAAKRRIECLARAELDQSPYPAVRDVMCEYGDGKLILRGHVFSYFQKQVAQTLVMHQLEGVVVINNQLRVEYP